MNINNFSKFIKSRMRPTKGIVKVSTMFSLNKEKSLLSMFKRFSKLIFRLTLKTQRVSLRLRSFNNFVKLLFKTYNNHGSTYVVKWLKACSVCLQQQISGRKLRSLRAIEPDLPLPRLINGLPAIINRHDRFLINSGNYKIIKLWFSIFNIYRVLEAPRKLKLETITDKFMGNEDSVISLIYEVHNLIGFHFNKNSSWFHDLKLENLAATTLVKSLAGGPNTKIAFQGVLLDALALLKEVETFEAYKSYCSLTNSTLNPSIYAGLAVRVIGELTGISRFCSNDRLSSLLTEDNRENNLIRDYFNDMFSEEQIRNSVFDYKIWGWQKMLNLAPIPSFERTGNKIVFSPENRELEDIVSAKLSFLPEAAGKLRVIAIVDIWTQSLLKPLHKLLFAFLAKLPNDGTFDQDAAFARIRVKSLHFGKGYSVDLSAATDRLPIALQEGILTSIFGSDFGTTWADLIVNRSYHIIGTNSYTPEGLKSVKYGCGQPMGCYSSFAMLALTHHLILQVIARRLFPYTKWYEDYEILGDDLVIFNSEVYSEYMKIMSDLGVQTNPSKSMISDNIAAAEFAKRTSLHGIDVSGLSWGQFIAENSMNGKITTIISLGRKGLLTSPNDILNILLGNDWKHDTLEKLDVKSSAILNASLLNVLSYFVNSNAITYEQAVASTVDPSDEGGISLNFKVPLQMTMLNIVKLFSQEYNRMINIPTTSEEETSFFISNYNKRMESVNGGLIHYLINGISNEINTYMEKFSAIPKAILKLPIDSPKLLKFLEKETIYDTKRVITSILSKEALEFIKGIDPLLYKSLYILLDRAAIGFIETDQDVVTCRYDVMINEANEQFEENPSALYQKLLDIREDISTFTMSYDLEPRPTKDLRKNVRPYLIRDFIIASKYGW
jgi:hypothetical protein